MTILGDVVILYLVTAVITSFVIVMANPVLKAWDYIFAGLIWPYVAIMFIKHITKK